MKDIKAFVLLIAITFSLSSYDTIQKTPEEMMEILSSEEEKEIGYFTNNFLFKVVIPLSAYKRGEANEISCGVCELGVSALANLIDQRKIDSIYKIANTLCQLVMTKNFCEPVIKSFGDIAFHQVLSFMQKSGEFCARLGYCPYEGKHLNANNYAVYLLKDKPEKEREPIDVKAPRFSFVQLTDVHYDKKYKAGSDAELCGYSLCCRDYGNRKHNPNAASAGKFGYPGMCDTSEAMFDSFLDKVDELKPDFIIWSGDNTPHDIWVNIII